MMSPIVVGGLSKTGKTSFICSLLHLALKYQLSFAAIKPFDQGLLKRYAAETPNDGERYCQYMKGEPMESLVSPYCANESYPVELSYRRDGIRINWNLIQQRLKVLNDLYDRTFIEIPSSLLTPLTEKRMVIDWLKELTPHVIWLIHPLQDQFTNNLHEIRLLKQSGIEFSIVFNNVSQIVDQDLVFYLWEKIEDFAGQQAAGMLPYLPQLDEAYEKISDKLEKAVPPLVEFIFKGLSKLTS